MNRLPDRALDLAPPCTGSRVSARASGIRSPSVRMEIVVAVLALASLLAAQAMLSSAIVATNYYGVDGKMAQTTIIAAFKFGSPFSVNNISPIAGIGSQMLPMNAWGNLAYWPFAF